MKTKETAVQYLWLRIIENFPLSVNDENYLIMWDAVNTAVKMEIQQMEDCWDNGYVEGYDQGKFDDEPLYEDAKSYIGRVYGRYL